MGIFDSTTSTKPTMYGPAKDLTKDILKDANKDFNKGVTGAYTGSMVTPFSDQTKSAFGGLTSLAGANTGGAGMSGHLQSILDNGGFSTGQLDTMSGMRDLSKNAYFDQTINGDGLTADQRLVADRYRTGMGETFGTNDAYNRVKEDALAQQRMVLDANAAKAGRYGGGASQTILAREQGSLGANMDVGELDKWRARTDAAAGNLAGLSQTGTQNRAGAISQQSGLQSGLFNAENAGISNMANAYQTAQQPYMTQRAVGQEYENLYSQQLADQKRIADELDPLKRQQEYMALATGTPTGSTQTASPSLGQLIMGGGLGVLGLASGLGGWGAGGAPATGGF